MMLFRPKEELHSAMKDAIQIISIGQCGCRIGKGFESMGIPTMYINSDEVDFRNFGVSSDKMLLIEGSGTGGSPTKGAKIFKRYKEQILEFVLSRLSDDRMIWVIFGGGGGTGNSIGPLLIDYLLSHKYPTGCISTLPSSRYNILAADNALKTLRILKDMPLNMFVLADNDLLEERIGLGQSNWWQKVNQHIILHISSIFDILREGKMTQTGLGSIDRGEIMRILQYGNGMADVRSTYLTLDEFNQDDRIIAEKLFSPSLIEGYSYKTTKAYLVSVDVPIMGGYTDHAKKIFDLTKEVAGTAVSRLGMFVDPLLTNSIKVTLVNAGLSFPKTIQLRINNLQRDEGRFIEKKNRKDSMDFSNIESKFIDDDNFTI